MARLAGSLRTINGPPSRQTDVGRISSTLPRMTRLWPAYVMRTGHFWPAWYFQMRRPVDTQPSLSTHTPIYAYTYTHTNTYTHVHPHTRSTSHAHTTLHTITPAHTQKHHHHFTCARIVIVIVIRGKYNNFYSFLSCKLNYTSRQCSLQFYFPTKCQISKGRSKC